MMASSNYWSSHSNGRGVSTSSSSIAASTLPAVSRSAEWWSCIRTAVKIAQSTAAAASATLDPQQQQQQPWWVGWNPPVQLPAPASLEQSEVWQLQEDGLSLLRGMQAELQKLQSLVRRRGHTNDPTQDIAHSVRQLELDAQELATLIQQQQQQQQQRRYSAQYQRHVALVAQWLQQAAAQQASQLKEILQVRANVLQEQAQQRRKLLKTTTTNGAHDNTAASKLASPRSGNSLSNTNNAATAAAFQSPLFTATPQSLKTSQKRRTRLTASSSSVSASSQPSSQLYINGNSEGSSVPAVHSAPSSNGPYGSTATSAAGYSYYGNGSSTSSFGGGGYGGGSTSMGIRRRTAAGAAAASNRAEDATVTSQEDWVVQEQIQERQKQRQTQYRVEAARQAERTLSELSTLFGKMSMLITQQSETLQKVEDDVESAVADVSAGQAELQILHSIKKGNRSLILKVFGLLIFFIIFMKFYANKRR